MQRVSVRCPAMTLAQLGEDQSHFSQLPSLQGVVMKHLKRIAAGTAVAGALGLAALGIGTGVANAAPPAPGTQWAQDWGPGPGPWGGPWGGPGWAPPPPAPYYGNGGYDTGYGGYDAGPPCITGPLGFVHICV